MRDAWAETRRRIAALEAEAAELLVTQIAFHDEDVASTRTTVTPSTARWLPSSPRRGAFPPAPWSSRSLTLLR